MAKYTSGTDYKNTQRRPEKQIAPGKPIPGFNQEGSFDSRRPTRTVPGQGAMPTPAGATKGDTGTAPTSGATQAPGGSVPGSDGAFLGFNSRSTPEGNARAIMGSVTDADIHFTTPAGAVKQGNAALAPPTASPPSYPTSIGPLPPDYSSASHAGGRKEQLPQPFDAPEQTSLPDYDAPGTD